MLEVEGATPKNACGFCGTRWGRHRQRLCAAAAAAAAAAVRHPGIEYPDTTPKPYAELRPAPRSLVCAESPRRGFRRNVCRLARPELHVGEPLRRWPAQRKLEYGSPDAGARRVRPRVSSQRRMDPLPAEEDAREHYRKKRTLRARSPGFHDSDLYNLFSNGPETAKIRRRHVSSAASAAKCAAPSPASPTAISTRSIS
jgi:hypothetical protein